MNGRVTWTWAVLVICAHGCSSPQNAASDPATNAGAGAQEAGAGGSHDSDDDGASGASGAGTTGGGGAASAAPGGASGPPASMAGPCTDPAPPPAVAAWTYAATETSVSVAAGEEGMACEKLPVGKPMTPRPTYLTAFDSRVDDGTHHQVLFFRDTPSDQAPCVGSSPKLGLADFLAFSGRIAEGGWLAFLATGVGDYSWRLPEGYGIWLGDTGDGHWETNHHLLNLGSAPTTIGGTYEFHVQDHVAYPLARMFTTHTDIHVPAGTTGSAEGTFVAPFDLDLVLLASHLHEHGVRFEMFFHDGTVTEETPFYVSETWDSPRAVLLDPPLRIAAGQGISYRCTYDNFEPGELVYGTTKGYEMCSLWNYYAYPAGYGFAGLRPPELGGENAVNGSIVHMKLGGTSDGSTLEALAMRDHQANVNRARSACPTGLAGAVDGGMPAEPTCALISDACFACIGTTCGASYGACQQDASCMGASAVATQCLCDAQVAQDAAAVAACSETFAASGTLASDFAACLQDQCRACGT